MTQSRLALGLGLSQARLSALERDPGSLSVDQLLGLCASLGLQLSIAAKQPGGTPGAEW